MGTTTGITMIIRQRIGAIALSMLLSTLLPEMLSGNTPVETMAKPAVFLFYLFAYGLPALVIREFAVRNSVGLTGLFLLGLGYGLVNEALFAKTVFLQSGVPVDVYDGYGYAFGIQWAWTAFILPWHAIASITLPIAFAHISFPQTAGTAWIGKRLTIGVALALMVLISIFYLYEDTSTLPRSPQALAILWGIITALAFIALRLPAKTVSSPAGFSKWKQTALGFFGIVPFLSLLAAAHNRWPLAAYFALAIGWIAFYRFLIRRFADVNLPGFGWFGLGWFLQIGVFSWLGIAARSPFIVAVDTAVFVLLWGLLRTAERRLT